MSAYKVTVSTELEDGRGFECRYIYIFYPGFTSGLPENCYPDESDAGEPDYYIDGVWVDYSTLTPELSQLADEMYEAEEDTKRFRYRSEEDDNLNGPDDY